MTARLVVLDIGKTNARLSLIDPATGAQLASHRRSNTGLDGTPRQLDVAGLRDWILGRLADLPERGRIGAIVPVAHGAACVMLDARGEPVLAPDYEDPLLGSDPAYEAARDPFALTFSPSLPAGLNLGRQLHWTQHHAPDLFGRVAAILPYAQYWAYVLSGVPSSEVTSLGCHSDLWQPGANRFSPLAERAGWARLFPPLRRAADRVGPIRPAIASHCGLPPDCAVLCGIHDSNAAYLCHRTGREADERFGVVSSGTWTVVLASHVDPSSLDPSRDMLANVDANGRLVGTARFMGGREYEIVAGTPAATPTIDGLSRALASGALVRPPLAAGGPFAGRRGGIERAEALDPAARASLASFYLAILTVVTLDLLGVAGDLVIDGPLARNPLYPGLIAACRPDLAVLAGDDAGSAGGACCLLAGAAAPLPRPRRVSPVELAPSVLEQAKDRWLSLSIGGA